MRVHLDFGYFCWQFVSEFQHNLEHVDEETVSVHELSATDDDSVGAVMGFARKGVE